MRTVPSSKAQNVFAVELWSDDGEQILETLATAGNFPLARAAYDEGVRRYPGRPVTYAATQTGSGAAQVLSSSQELARQSETLKSKVEGFFTQIRAA